MRVFLRPAAAIVGLTLMAIGLAPAAGGAEAVDPTPRVLRVPRLVEDTNLPAALASAIKTPEKMALTANDWGCRPSSRHPDPVILIHGTWENAYDNWNGLAPILTAEGYCVFAVNYANTTGIPWMNGTGDLVRSADEIAAFVRQVRDRTGAAHVSLVGHSQGGAQARYYANLLAPEGEVTSVIMIAPSNHAITYLGLKTAVQTLGLDRLAKKTLDIMAMPAAFQQATNTSPFYRNLNSAAETVPGISYTTINTKYDEVVTPYTVGYVAAGPGATVDNIVIQDVCPLDLSEHLSISYSKNVAQVILNKLDPTDQHAIRCYVQAPVVGGTRF